MTDMHRNMDSFVYLATNVPAGKRRRTDAEKRQKDQEILKNFSRGGAAKGRCIGE